MTETGWTTDRTADAIRRERDRGLNDLQIAVLFEACPRSFPPGPWTAYGIRVAGRRGKPAPVITVKKEEIA